MNRTRLLSLATFLSVSFSALADLPYLNIESDVQRPDVQFDIKRVFSGNTPMIRWLVTDGGRPADLTNWTFRLWYAFDNSATQGWSVGEASHSSNAVIFHSVTNFFAIPNDNYYCSILGTHIGGDVRTWAVGKMNQKWDFAAGNPSTNLTGFSSTTLNWSVFSSYSGTWPFYAGDHMQISLAGNTGISFAAVGFATNGQWNQSVSGASNLAYAIGAGATGLSVSVGAGATNLALAIGSGATSLTMSAWATASNAVTQVVFTAVSSSSNFIGTPSSKTGAILFASYCVTNGAAGGGSGTLTGAVIGAGSSGRLTATNSGAANVTLNLDATGLATGTPIYVETDSSTNVTARLASNVWAAADSTTNYVARTGGDYTAANAVDWQFNEFGLASSLILGGSTLLFTLSEVPQFYVDANGIHAWSGVELLTGVYSGNGSGLTGLNGAAITNLSGGSVSLTTNAVLVLDSTPGDWTASRTLAGPSTNNGVSVPLGDGYVAVDGVSWPAARCETAMTNTWQTRNIVSRIVDAGEIQTNVAAVRVIFAGASATSTQTLSFVGISSNTFANVTVTTAGTYTAAAAPFATNRRWHVQIPMWVPAQVGTNAGWVSVPAVEVVKQ